MEAVGPSGSSRFEAGTLPGTKGGCGNGDNCPGGPGVVFSPLTQLRDVDNRAAHPTGHPWLFAVSGSYLSFFPA